MFEKMQAQGQGLSQGQGERSRPKGNGGVKCGVCQGPHTPQEYKWKPGACYTCGQVGHTVAQCKNPVLKNAFYYHCTQRGHLYSECLERKSSGKPDSGKPTARVYAIQYEEASTVDTFVGTLSIASHLTYTLLDTGATHSCMSKEFMNACSLSAGVVPNF